MEALAEESVKTENKKTKRLILLLLKLTVSITLLAYLISKLDLSALSKLEANIIYYLIASTVIMLIAEWFMTFRWKIVLLLIKAREYSLALLFKFYLIGSFFSIFIPGAIGGDAMRVYYASKAYHITKTLSLLSVFIERIAGLFALSVILMISLLFNDVIRSKLNFGYATVLLVLAGLGMVLVLGKYLIGKKIDIDYSHMFIILLFSGLGQFGDILISYIYSLYFDLNITILNLMAIMPLVYVATVIPISLGGVGVREGVMTAGMALYGVDVADAVMVSFLLYITKIVVGLLGWYVYMKIDTMKRSTHE